MYNPIGITLAGLNCTPGTIQGIICTISGIISSLVPIVIAFAVLVFLWGLALYIKSAGDDAAKTQGRNIMIWGTVALFVMVSVWGLVALLKTSFGIPEGQQPSVNQLLPQP